MKDDNKLSRKSTILFFFLNFLSLKWLTVVGFLSFVFLLGLTSSILNFWLWGVFDFMILLRDFLIFLTIAGLGIIAPLLFRKRAPIFTIIISIQMNFVFVFFFGASYLFGELLAVFTRNFTFIEVFFIMGAVLAYILAFIIYFSFTTVGRPWYLFLALTQPTAGIILYGIFTSQLNISFFINAAVFFCSSAFIFAIPYATGMWSVSTVYRTKTGIGGYNFIRAFVLSILTEKNDDMIEEFFDQVGIFDNIEIKYLAIRSISKKQIKGLFLLPDVHFGPFKTSGSSDLPELIYDVLPDIKGTTVYHTTNTHAKNTTKQFYNEKLIDQIVKDTKELENQKEDWNGNFNGFSREIEYSAKVLGAYFDKVPILFVSRHPYESDDIEPEVGESIIKAARKSGYKNAFVVDSHNAIIGDEILISKESKAGKDIIEVCKKFVKNHVEGRHSEENEKILYGVARDPLKEFSAKDGIGKGGLVVHLFYDVQLKEKIALIHFDGNNALLEVRPMIFNFLQNKGIDKGEITTSDSHSVARIFTARGYKAIGERIKVNYILQKLNALINEAEKDLEPVQFKFKSSTVEAVKIWGDMSYFSVVMETLQRCINVSKLLVTIGLLVPTFFSLLLLFFYYNIDVSELIP